MRKLIVLFFVVCLLSGVSLALASHGGLPSVGWNSGQQIQNIGSAPANVQLVAYTPHGFAYSCPEQVLAFGESHTYLSDEDELNKVCLSDDFTEPLTLPWGFSGSGVVHSDQPLAGIVNIHNMGFGRAAGQYNATLAAVVATNLAFPLVKYNHGSPGRTTTFYIQNASSTNNTITATFHMGGTPYSTSYRNVKPYARVILQPGDAVTSTAVTVGSLIVTGTQSLAGISLEHPTDEPVITGMQASRAFVASDYDDTLHCPLLRYQWAGAQTTTGLQVQNVGDQETDITVEYTVISGTVSIPVVTTMDVLPGASANFLQENHFEPETLASAVITSDPAVDLVAVVNDRADGTNPKRYLTYACFSDDNATTKVSLPLAKEHFHGNTSGVQVQNTGDLPIHLVLTYTTNTTNWTFVISTTSPIAAGASKTFWNLTGGGTKDIEIITTTVPIANFVNSNSGVIVESQSWNASKIQPIVAMAIESSENIANPQDSKSYEGVNLE